MGDYFEAPDYFFEESDFTSELLDFFEDN